MRVFHALAVVAVLAVTPAFAAGAPKKGDGGGGDDRIAKRISASPNYLHGPTHVTALPPRAGAGRASITVEMGWDVQDPALRARMQLMRPRLTNATREALAEYVANRHRSGAQPNLEQLSQLLQIATDQTVGGAGARVMLANVVILDR